MIQEETKAIKIYKKFYDYFVYRDNTLNSLELEQYLTLKKETNEYSNKHATTQMVVANQLLYFDEYSKEIPIGCIMNYRKLNKKYPTFKKLMYKKTIEDVIDLSILASDALKQMHDHQNIHTDLHSKNFGITVDNDVCIFDCDGCYIGKKNATSKKASTVQFYESFGIDSYTTEFDKYSFALMILQILSTHYINKTNPENINKAINNLKINNDALKNYFQTLLNPTIEQCYAGDILKKTKKMYTL